MRALDKNQNGTISFEEFDQYCVQLKLSEGISQESLQRLYRYLDANGDGNLSVDELNSIVSAANLTHEELMDSAFSADLVRELEQEIETQFRSLDKDGSGYLEAQELAFFMKQQEAGYQISESQAARVIAELN
jgi:Ca2+-binding EF-hand superfamily protein